MPFTDIRVIHTVASLKKSAGGPSRTVTALCGELGRLGAEVQLLSQAYSTSTNDMNLIPPADLASTALVAAFHLPSFRTIYSPSFRSSLLKHGQRLPAALIHDHGLWLPTNHAAAAVARKLDVPLMISPRGMLEPWALNYRAWKKRLAWCLYQHRDLQTARALHATALQEADNLRRLGLRQPIAVVPNGVKMPPLLKPLRSPATPHIALFLSRIHPKKGLLELVEAWRVTRPSDWKVIIAGPDEGGHRRVVEEKIRRAGLGNNFEFAGMVDGAAKTALYQRAELFLLPSFTENFGVVVAEALACGVPVITTKGTPWQGLMTHRCGWWIDIGVEHLIAAIQEATSLLDEERHAMGQRGRQYVERNFGWSSIAEQMLSVYRWILGQGDKPDCVMTD